MASSWIWQQPDWPRFRWKGSALEPLLKQARAARQDLLSRLATLESPLDREAISALLHQMNTILPQLKLDSYTSAWLIFSLCSLENQNNLMEVVLLITST